MSTLVPVAKLDKVEVQRIIAGECSLAEFNAFQKQIEDRMNYVVRKIVELSNLSLEWWDFDNLGEGEDDRGHFDIEAYSKSVGITGERTGSSYKNMCFEKYEKQIPVQFLWIDFEEQVAKEFEDFKNHIDVHAIHAANKAVEAKQAFDCMVASIKTKLTPEELAYIEFKFPKRSSQRRK